jgi:hydrogenase maturation protease
MKKLDRTIILGIGNNGRQDDGLGWLFLDSLKDLESKLTLEYRYQLQIEDAELISNYKTVIFVDASKSQLEGGFCFESCHPSEQYSFSTHALEPQTILHLANKLYTDNPNAFLFAIQGYNWELKIGLSKKAQQNLNKALNHFKNKLLIDYI